MKSMWLCFLLLHIYHYMLLSNSSDDNECLSSLVFFCASFFINNNDNDDDLPCWLIHQFAPKPLKVCVWTCICVFMRWRLVQECIHKRDIAPDCHNIININPQSTYYCIVAVLLLIFVYTKSSLPSIDDDQLRWLYFSLFPSCLPIQIWSSYQ